ncbi:MAG: hypothetical protein K2P51_06005 [Rhabdochlamydiaceae bacterium]|nr:hypothetical protein [Rhabdochlamydiaceae bacterium]
MDQSDFVIKDNVRKSERKSLEKDPVARRLLKDPALSHEFKSWLQRLYHQDPVELSRVENVTLPHGVLLFNSLLKKVAEKYSRKYAIEILICNTEEFEELISSDFISDHPIGVIVTADHDIDCGFYYYKSFENTMHVTPVLLNFKKGKREAVILDSAGVNSDGAAVEPLSEFVECTLSHESKEACTTYIAQAPRQADSFSCRTDALIILRNALLDLKHGFENFGAKVAHASNLRFVSLPLQWSYTSQIFDPLDSSGVPKKFFSQSPGSKYALGGGNDSGGIFTVCGRTLEAFWQKYFISATFRYELQLPQSVFSLQQIPSLVEGYAVTSRNDKLSIEFVQTRTVSDYLRLKGLDFSKGVF